MSCSWCKGTNLVHLGDLGRFIWLRCQDCGMEQSLIRETYE